MPNLPTHIKLALDGAAGLGYPELQAHLGSFILGCTAPDIRTITRWDRIETHFAPLEFRELGAGVSGLMAAHPHLAETSRLNDATRAFMAGFLHHIIADEAWILDIYRPYFARPAQPDHNLQTNLWDRALQLDMDRVAREEMAGMEEVRRLLGGAEVGVDIGFIDPSTLTQWREWVTEFTRWEFSWDRLRRMARRICPEDSGAALELIEEFLQGMPGSLKRIYVKVPRQRLDSFKERTNQEFINVARRYLSGVTTHPGAGPG